MRMIYLALVVSVLVLALAIVSAARSSDPEPQRVAGNYTLALKLPGLDRARYVMSVMSPREAPLQFCGQCSQDSDCGTGHKCCDPSNCLECSKVVTCP